MSVLHIHAPQPCERRVVSGDCPDCKKRSRFLAFFIDWYGWDQTCLRCGRQWQDGEWMPFAFYRHARRDSIEGAKTRWRRFAARVPA